MINIRRYAPTFLILAVFLLAPSLLPAAGDSNLVRVCVINGISGISLTVDGKYRMTDANTGQLIKQGGSLYRVKVYAKPKGILFGKDLLNTARIRIMPKRDGIIYIDRWRFRGYVDIAVNENSRIKVINGIDMEDYLKGVLYHEVSHRWPYEALKAQAIAARTYAFYQKQVMAKKDFDVRSDIYSQVYGGRRSERYKTNKAVDLTKGKVLIYDGNIFPAYYHATCAGYTEDSGNLWNINLPPLKGVECRFCARSKHLRWKKKLRLADIEAALREKGYPVKEITSIEILGRNRSNRINELLIKSDGGDITIFGKDLRQIAGPNVLRSNNYVVEVAGSHAVFMGLGWGHGVGMCQWGAYFMSLKGYTARQILNHYYPGAKIETR
ncbi:MAG: SpoIID/LytB domain-containing protein [Candidatus Omnitrophota bacterium]